MGGTRDESSTSYPAQVGRGSPVTTCGRRPFLSPRLSVPGDQIGDEQTPEHPPPGSRDRDPRTCRGSTPSYPDNGRMLGRIPYVTREGYRRTSPVTTRVQSSESTSAPRHRTLPPMEGVSGEFNEVLLQLQVREEP